MANIAKHGVDMGSAADFDFETAKTSPDTRQNYGEDRVIALDFIAHRLHVLVSVLAFGCRWFVWKWTLGIVEFHDASLSGVYQPS